VKQFVSLSDNERQEIFQEAAARLGIMPAIVEKDFWVTWILNVIFADSVLSQQLMFKGGTSLSKVYGLIERFSEDIDLILDWQQITDKNPTDPILVLKPKMANSVSSLTSKRKAILPQRY
jgi:predicted nucleotidyltransferase component of viral defense system